MRTGPAGISAVSRPGGTSSRASPTCASRARATRARAAAGALRFQVAIEVGHIFKLETRYSVPLGAVYLDESGSERPILMGSYGIGPGRILAAAVEQRHDEAGICWPRSLTPYDVHVVAIGAPGDEASALAERAGEALEGAGLSVLLDDRDRRPGEKFADADLLGCPLRVTVGRKSLEDGQVDVLDTSDPSRGAGTGRRRRRPITHHPGGTHMTRRRFSERPFGDTLTALMAEQGMTYRQLAAKAGLSAGYLNHMVHGNRPVPANDVMARLADALGVEPEHFREYRIRLITERLEEMPELVDRLYRRLAEERARLRPGARPRSLSGPEMLRPVDPRKGGVMAKTKFVLTEKSIPKAWYNIQADLPQPLPPVIHPGTGEPIGPDDLAPLFPDGASSARRSARSAGSRSPIRSATCYRLWRPTPLFRARRLEQALDTPAHIYYKYEGVSPAGSHKPNTAVAQAFYNKEEGVKGLTTETGAGQWGSSLAMACYVLRPRVRGLHGEDLLRAEAVPAQHHADVRRERHAEPLRPDERGPLDPRAGPGVARLARHRHLGSGRGGGHKRRREEVLARLGAEPRPPAPDRHRPRGARAVRAGRRSIPTSSSAASAAARTSAASRCRSSATTSRAARRRAIVAVEPAAAPSLTKGRYIYDFGDTAA